MSSLIALIPREKRGVILLRAAIAVAVAAVLQLAVLPHIHATTSSGKWQSPLPVIALGVIIGMTYGLLAAGLVLIFRSNRIINFAHGEIGAFGSAFFGLIAVRFHVPYWVAFPLALILAAGAAAAAEVGVIRRLRKAPRLMSVVATLGVGQFLVLFAFAFNNQAGAGSLFPQPAGLPVFNLGALRITQAYSGMLILSPVVVIALAVFLKRSRFGMGIRAAAANPEAARMAGIFSGRMSTLSWALAGMLSCFTAILTQPTQGFTSAGSTGPSLLLRALAAGVLARMASLPLALAGGVALGVIEQLLLWNFPRSGLVEVTLFVIILGTLLVQKQRAGRDEDKGSWAAVQALRPIPEQLRKLWLVRNLGPITAIAVFGLAAALPLWITNANSVTLTGIFGFAIVAMSVGLVTGLGGQLSLGQFALAAVGGAVSVLVSSHTGSFFIAFLYGGLSAAAVSLVIALPALRIRGLLLTVTTLSFALVTPAWLLQQEWLLGSGKNPNRPRIFGHTLETGRSYYGVGLFCLFVIMILAWNVRRTGLGRLLIAVRDNEDNARAFTVRASLVKIQAFMLAGFVAGIGGAMYAHSLSRIGATTFPTSASIDVVKMAVIGGVSLLSGPLIGALFVQGIPAFLPLDSAGLAAASFGQLIILLYLPGGLGGLVEPVRDRTVKFIGRRAGIDVEAAYAPGEQREKTTADLRERNVIPVRRNRLHHGEVLLEVDRLAKSFGGVHAVRGVSFDVKAGEILGLIGPNGAGKTTTFELLGGFTKADSGRVSFAGEDITNLGPEARARRGLIRSFQDAALFPTMTVLECVQLSLEREAPTRFFSSCLGLLGDEKKKETAARDLVAFMGLDRYRNRQVQELSTGTRRFTEIACLVGLRPICLLLDEPSSGIAQRETEALGGLLRDIKQQLDLTLVIIEHDIPLIMGLSDRIIAMADGEVIAHGPPEVVRHDPAVVEAYLGGSMAAIERSGAGGTQTHAAPEPVGAQR